MSDYSYAELLRENERLQDSCDEVQSRSAIYTHIANALVRDYTDLFYVNMETGEFIEYYTDDERGELVESRRAPGFFESCEREAKVYVHPDDQDMFIRAMKREFLEDALADSMVFEMSYRRYKYDRMFYVLMKVSRMVDDRRIIVIAVSDIDELVKKRQQEERIRNERIVYSRLHAIAGNYIVIYVVNPLTDRYYEFNSIDQFSGSRVLPKEGVDFFERGRSLTDEFVYPEDRRRFLMAFTKEGVLGAVENGGIFTLGYRFMMGDKPIHAQMRAAMVDEEEGPRLIVALYDIDEQMRQEEEIERRLVQAQAQANRDGLTGVKNKHAYQDAASHIDRQIREGRVPPFAIVMMDTNDLKMVNDSGGHQAGDRYLLDACAVICEVFKHSPVFRIGGDEFVAIVQGSDYASIEERMGTMRDHNDEATANHGVVIACGMARYAGDACVADVFARADHDMYMDKARLKGMRRP